MGIRLYENAWVLLRELDTPQQVRKDVANPAVFHVGGQSYDIDGRAIYFNEAVPEIVRLLSLADTKALGFSTQYQAPKALYA